MGTIGERYELIREIGRGGCAYVWEARDLFLGRAVAIKIANASSASPGVFERLVREGRVGASLSHPNVCNVSDAGQLPDGTPYIVMERLIGETLRSVMRRRGRLDPRFAIDVAVQVLSALDAAHEQRVVHRDVKPDNIFLVSRRGCRPLVKLLDFGLCCTEGERDVTEMELTTAGTVVGTPEYMSPEQAAGMRFFDRRVDVFALGLVLYEALTGARAFSGADTTAVVMSILVDKVRRMKGVPEPLAAVVMHALMRDPDERHEDARELQEDLLEVLAELSPSGAFPAVHHGWGGWGGRGAPTTWPSELPTRRIA